MKNVNVESKGEPCRMTKTDYEKEFYIIRDKFEKISNENEKLKNIIIEMCKTIFIKTEQQNDILDRWLKGD